MRRLREILPLGGAQMSEMARIIDDQNEKVGVPSFGAFYELRMFI